MPWGYMDIVIARAELDLGVDFGAAEAVNKVTNEGNPGGGDQGSNKTLTEHVIKIVFQCVEFNL
ncbi:hypothetical protein C0993_006844 [Termitomyces sp. T159_Od127]|nr:hypothetical protein C0993_006844 [Termitomyces sp. T159_Od127]